MRAAFVLASIASLIAMPAVADPADPPSPDPVLAFYPNAALQRGISGSATLNCARTEHGGFANCRVEAERPNGEGFGHAAMALAAKAVECPALSLRRSQRMSGPVYFAFSASPLFITPNPLRPDWPIVQGRWLQLPTGDDMAATYPAKAWQRHVDGYGAIVCAGRETGLMGNCIIVDEAPEGWGFGYATLQLSRRFKVELSKNCAGDAVLPAVVITVGWKSPG